MAKTIIRNSPNFAVVICSAASTETITLGTDLLFGSETADTPTVVIKGITWSVPVGNATITRNSVVQWVLTLSNHFRFDGGYDSRNATSDIVVVIPAGGGTVLLQLGKVSGFGDAQFDVNHTWQTTTTSTTTTTTAH